MSDHQRKINRLLNEAERCDDPRRLVEIETELTEWGVWNAAAFVRNRKREVERAYAESVNG